MDEADNESSNQSESDTNYKSMKKSIKNAPIKKKKNIGELLGNLLKKKIKSNIFIIKENVDPILAKNKQATKKFDDEAEKEKEVKKNKKDLLLKRKLGYKNISDWDKKSEKLLVKTATKGVVKLFNSIYDFRKKIRDAKEKESKNLIIIFR